MRPRTCAGQLQLPLGVVQLPQAGAFREPHSDHERAIPREIFECAAALDNRNRAPSILRPDLAAFRAVDLQPAQVRGVRVPASSSACRIRKRFSRVEYERLWPADHAAGSGFLRIRQAVAQRGEDPAACPQSRGALSKPSLHVEVAA